MIVTARFMLCLFRLFSLHGFLLAIVDNVLAVGLHTVVILLRADNDFVELAKTRTGRDEVSADNVLLHTLEIVYLATYSRFVEHLGCLLERCCRHEALGLESGTRNTLEYLCRRCRNGITHLHSPKVAALQC